MMSCWASLEFRLLKFQCSDRILNLSDSDPDILHILHLFCLLLILVLLLLMLFINKMFFIVAI